MNNLISKIQRIVGVIFFTVSIANAQTPQDSELFKTLKAKDSLMFEVGFNNCQLELISSMITEELEFYHDKDGVIKTRAAFIKTLEENLCTSGTNRYKRMLEQESLQVYPLHENGALYGAVLTGRHSFGTTMTSFTHLFLLEEGKWMASKMLSYDHKTSGLEKQPDLAFIELSSDELSIYLGDYEFSPDFVLSIIKEGDKVFGDAQGQKVEIKPYGLHKFSDESQTTRLTFTSNQNGLISGLLMQTPDGEMMAKKKN